MCGDMDISKNLNVVWIYEAPVLSTYHISQNTNKDGTTLERQINEQKLKMISFLSSQIKMNSKAQLNNLVRCQQI